jgi:membrane-associated phospholipid phosphatase
MNSSEARLAWLTFNFNWLPIAALGLALAFAAGWNNFTLEPVAIGVTCAVAFALALTVYVHSFLRAEIADPKLVFWFGTTAQVILTTAVVGPLSYVANAFNWPLQDQALLSIDRAMGMDPEVILAFVNDHRWLAECFVTSYGLIKWPLLGIPIVLAMTLRLVRLQQFVLALNIALAVTIVISIFVPAVGTYYGMNLSPQRFPFVDASIYAAQLRDIGFLRDGSLRHLELFKLAGIVSFPSFHAASAVLYMWALWPIRGIGWPASAVYALMIAATPVIGAHYVIDVIAGIVVAAGSILLAKHSVEMFAYAKARDVGVDFVGDPQPRARPFRVATSAADAIRN